MSDRTELEGIKQSVRIEDVIGEYVDLTPDGQEYKALCPFHEEDTPSFYVVAPKDFYHCFGCGAHGDVMDFVCEYQGVKLPEAKRILKGESEATEAAPAKKRSAAKKAPEWKPIIPIPEDAPRLIRDGRTRKILNPKRAGTDKEWTQLRPDLVDEYRRSDGALVGCVLRLNFDDGRKATPQVTYCEGPDGKRAWAMVAMPAPRPLLGADDLARRPDARVIVVEGEKTRRAAQKLMQRNVVVSWCGGTKAVDKTDWSDLAGRHVIIWPDADQAGQDAADQIAARIADQTAGIQIIDVSDRPDGWDAADAQAEGWTGKDVGEWAKPRMRAPVDKSGDPGSSKPSEPEPSTRRNEKPSEPSKSETPQRTKPTAPAKPASESSGERTKFAGTPEQRRQQIRSANTSSDGNAAREAVESDEPFIMVWKQLGLDENSNGLPHNNLNNAVRIMEAHPAFKGRIWYDEFHQRYFTNWMTGEVREWSDYEDLHVTLFIQRKLGLVKMTDDMVHKALIAVAKRDLRNEPAEWMQTLKWDGQRRVEGFLRDYFGAEDTDYTQAASMNFWVGMVARVMHPGCKMDNMLVLESPQGAGKSSALAAIGGPYYAEAHESVTSKDFYMTLQGKLIVEIGEMDAFSKAETTKVKQVITCTSDRYRAPYERAARDYPRRNLFVGTTNESQYLKDATGARRFWPVKCGRVIDVAGLERDREQLFAEALFWLEQGQTWWDMPEKEAKAAQEHRREVDSWEEILDDFLSRSTISSFTLPELMQEALEIDPARQDIQAQRRVGRAMRALGWERAQTTAGSSQRRVTVWKRDK